MAYTSVLATAGTFGIEYQPPTAQSDWRSGALITRAVNGNLGSRARRVFTLDWDVAPARMGWALREHYVLNLNKTFALDVPGTGQVLALWHKPPRISARKSGAVSMHAELIEALNSD